MLDLALIHQEELQKKMRATWMDDKYKWYHAANYHEDMVIHESTWVNHQFASLHNGEIIGYIGYQIDRSSEYAYGLNIIHFEEKASVIFAKDLGDALKNIFEKYALRRLEWTVIIGNPIEKSYDAMCLRYGGRIIGTYKNRTKLIDGRYYDEKLYEIELSDYIAAMNTKIKG